MARILMLARVSSLDPIWINGDMVRKPIYYKALIWKRASRATDPFADVGKPDARTDLRRLRRFTTSAS
jgi:hypothetical protein